MYQVTDGNWGSALATDAATVSESTQYTVKVITKLRHVHAWVVGQDAVTITHNSSALLGTGQSGFWADKTSVTFDDCQIFDGNWRDPLVPRFHGLADASISARTLLVTGSTRGGEAVVARALDDAYDVQVDVDLNSGSKPDIWFRHTGSASALVLRMLAYTRTFPAAPRPAAAGAGLAGPGSDQARRPDKHERCSIRKACVVLLGHMVRHTSRGGLLRCVPNR